MINSERTVAHKINCKPRTSDVAFDDSISFVDLRLKKQVLDGLREAGFEKPSPIQLKSIPLGKCGFDLVVQAKSGTGKTCVFATLILESLITSIDSLQALVLAPTREIAVQIWEVITRIGKHMPDLKCHAFIGGMSVEEDKKNLKTCHIAIATPGRMKHLMEQEVTRFEHVRFLVLDEADRLLDSSFKENVIWIYKKLPASKQMLTLSATYPESLARHVTKFMESAIFVRLNSDDPALLGVMQYYKTVPNHYSKHQIYFYKLSELLKIFNKADFVQCLVFSNYQLVSESLAYDLNTKRFAAACITACMEQKERLVAINKLKDFQCRVLVSTDLTCRGIDAELVDLIINFDVPNCYETYLHRIGRGGRFGSYSAAITLATEGNEFNSLAKIERLSNTSIACLPDPMPTDITTNPDVLKNSKIPSIATLYVTKMVQKITPENISEISKPCLKESTGQVDLSQNGKSLELDKNNIENLQDIDHKGLFRDMFDYLSRNNAIPSNTISLIDLFNKFDLKKEISTDDERSKIVKAIQRTEKPDALTNQEPNNLLNHSTPPNIDFRKLISSHFSNYFEDDAALLDVLAKLIPGKKLELEKVFQPKGTDKCDNTQLDVNNDKEDAGEALKLKGTSKDVKKILHKYSSKELLDIRKAMPDSYNDLSRISGDISLLTELKKGEYARVPFSSFKKSSGKRFKEFSAKNGGHSRISYENEKSCNKFGYRTSAHDEVLQESADLSTVKDKLPPIYNSAIKVESSENGEVPKESEVAPTTETSVATEKSEFAKIEMQVALDVNCREPSLINLLPEISQEKIIGVQNEELQNIPVQEEPAEFVQDEEQEIAGIEIHDSRNLIPSWNNGTCKEVSNNLLNEKVEKPQIDWVNLPEVTSSEILNFCHFSSFDSLYNSSVSQKAEANGHNESSKHKNAITECKSRNLVRHDNDASIRVKRKSIKTKKAQIPHDSATSSDSNSTSVTKGDKVPAPKMNINLNIPNNQYLPTRPYSSDDSGTNRKVNRNENKSKVCLMTQPINTCSKLPRRTEGIEVRDLPTKQKARHIPPASGSLSKEQLHGDFKGLIAQSQRMYQMAKMHTNYIHQLIQLNKFQFNHQH